MAFDREIGALTTFAEASGTSPLERRAVMHVLFNRVRLGFGHNVAEVCLKRRQFSSFNDEVSENNNLLRAARIGELDPAMQDCLAAYDEVLVGAPDPTRGATHFENSNKTPAYWAQGATLTLKTASFCFYKDVK